MTTLKHQALEAELEAELRALRIAILFRVFARRGGRVSFPRVGALLEIYDAGEISTALMFELRRKVANLWRAARRAALGLLKIQRCPLSPAPARG